MLEQLAKKYIEGDDVTPQLTTPSFTTVGDVLNRWIDWEHDNLPKDLSIIYTEKPDSYQSSQELHDDIVTNKRIFVFSLFCTHPLISEDTNRKFRAVHDYRHHFESGVIESDFGLYGEFCAYQKAKQDLFAYIWENEPTAATELYPTLDKILCSEIVLQAAVRLYTGEFADQKIVL
ncbi:MAG: hypothetical protein IM526_02995 [Microcystis sp. M38BS1]|uniref:hypothetical protein n=1 Tax=Microcystis sp. M38BS1 TaxID=2771188 RepID=UPI0031FD110D|nr:hypothetical protein [Microcystis sp. M38BS1]MCA6582630.1 hypothetical protein [Pseudanabaena sp. M34BS1SP1A06MG]